MFTSKTIVTILAAVAAVAYAAPSKASPSSSAIPSPSSTPYLTTFYLGNDAISNNSGCVVEVNSYTGCDGVAVLSGSQNCSAIQGTTISQPLCGSSSITADFQGGDRGTHLSYYDQNHELVAYCTVASNPGTSVKCATTD